MMVLFCNDYATDDRVSENNIGDKKITLYGYRSSNFAIAIAATLNLFASSSLLKVIEKYKYRRSDSYY